MASTSQNGWPKDPPTVRIYGDGDPDGAVVRAGDVAVVFKEFIDQFNATVEPVTQVNGYRSSAFNDSIAGSIKTSDHTSATAIDINGAQHPNEAVHPRNWTSGFTAAETAAVRRLLEGFWGLLQWGMDFPRGARDPMHFAIQRGVGADQIAALASAIRGNTPQPTPPTPDPVPAHDPLEDDVIVLMRTIDAEEGYGAIFLLRPNTPPKALNPQQYALWVRLGYVATGGDFLRAEVDIVAETLGG